MIGNFWNFFFFLGWLVGLVFVSLFLRNQSCILSNSAVKFEKQVIQSRTNNRVCLQQPNLPTYADSSGKQQSGDSSLLLAETHARTHTSTEMQGN